MVMILQKSDLQIKVFRKMPCSFTATYLLIDCLCLLCQKLNKFSADSGPLEPCFRRLLSSKFGVTGNSPRVSCFFFIPTATSEESFRFKDCLW